MPDIDAFKDKVEAFLPPAKHLLVGANERLSRRSLIRYLGPHMNDQKFSLMIRGRSDKGVPPGRISEDDLKKLAELLAKVIGGNFTTDEARQLWQGDLETFKAALGVGQPLDLFETLSFASAELEISVWKKKKTTLRAILSAQNIPHDALEVASNECIQFKIAGRPGRRLLVLCYEPNGVWRLIAPGPLHDGNIRTASTTLPSSNRSWLPIDPPFGVHEFIFIEHDSNLQGLLPLVLHNNRILDPSEIVSLARKLQTPTNPRRWRWGRKIVNAVDKLSPM